MINRVECHHGTRCPCLNGGDIWHLIGERDYLSQRLDEMEKVMALAQAEIEKLRQENQNLREEKEILRYELKQMLSKILEAIKLSQILMSTVPSGVPLVVIVATVADGQKRFRNLLTSILTDVISAAARLRFRKKASMSISLTHHFWLLTPSRRKTGLPSIRQ